ncbi:hypothetical protein CAOG_04068 [Capsaspora owczarzaki ATCC 30864]|uniref:MGAT4 conserved region domain-containing protein n=1 Tax=Capsaspora owczarzaki (strain ATCC 30864) TaxID=595528 RepID=A0A0D2UDV0_CAPO3|nr:hypothetical protein CAOG_04068 [Capsaspora owczarzaki ATCC 30864]KJE93256.1 hypothetical protein CAOG_004068 [Capsaspora owczarzaki ATCC 30864]|eukprot:XP_004347893.1 hypothetical protein CAOG_04068 [Capsaspora owczarzaki ATCC 30864]
MSRKRVLLMYAGIAAIALVLFVAIVNWTCSESDAELELLQLQQQQAATWRRQEADHLSARSGPCQCPPVDVALNGALECPPVPALGLAHGLQGGAAAGSLPQIEGIQLAPVRHLTSRLDNKDADVVLFHAEKHPAQRRTGAKLIMGIPTVRRPKAIYVTETLDALLSRATPNELNQMVFVLFLADKDPALLEELWTTVHTAYSQHIASGLIECVVSKSGAYRPWPSPMRRTFGDPEDRVMWRSKENYDYSLLMEYCKGRADYYMQLEDDILASRNYFKGIVQTVELAKDFQPPWSMLEFTRLGSYAKLFRDSELLEIAAFLRYLWLEQPTDWMMFNFVAVKMQNNRIFSRNALFQHIGKQSSLEGKRQDLVDHTFNENGDPGGIDGRPGDEVVSDRSSFRKNPPAEVVTNIIYRGHYSPRAFYNNERPMLAWLRKSQWIEVWFDTPQRLRRVLVRSGHPTRPTDVLVGGQLSALYEGESNYVTITTGATEIDAKNFDTTKAVQVLRLTVTEDHHYQTCFEQIEVVPV